MVTDIKKLKEKVTPEQAQKWLETMPPNRTVRERRVRSLVRAIQQDDWKLNGETIVLDQDGNLLDGQHRLLAVVRSKRALEMVVVTGVQRAAFATMDTGASRMFGDVLKIEGYRKSNVLAAAVRWHWRYVNRGEQLANEQTTSNELLRHMETHPRMEQWCKKAASGKHLGLNKGAMAAVLYEIAEHNDLDASQEFFALVLRGAEDEHHPAAVMHKRMINAIAMHSRAGRPSMDVICAVYIKCFNAWAEHRMIKSAHWRAGEPFPTVYEEDD